MAIVPQENWLDKQKAWSGELVSRRYVQWIQATRTRLLRAFPKPEQSFCRILDKMRSRMDDRSRKLLWYTRQKPFIVTAEFVFYGDFFFKALGVLVEIDGSEHRKAIGIAKDQMRSQMLSAHKIHVIRFTNDEVTGGDFRAIERKFIDEATGRSGRFHNRRYVANHYAAMQRKNPQLYREAAIVA